MSNTVPEGWIESLVGEIGELKTSSVDKKVCPHEPEALLVNYMDVYKNNRISAKLPFQKITANEKQLQVSAVKKGDILFTPSSETPDDIGHSAAVVEDIPSVLQSYHLVRLRPRTPNPLNLDFSAYAFSSSMVLEQFRLRATGSTRFTLSLGDFSEVGVRYPKSLPEQQKIADILSSVDKVIRKTRTQIDKLKDLKAGMVQELLTKGIGHTEFKDSAAGRIPVSWSIRLISDLCSHIVDCVNKTAPVVDYVTPYKMIRTTNVRNGRIVMDGMRYVSQETFHAWSRRLALRAGDLIFTREAPVGECGLILDSKGLFLGQRTMVYRAAPEKLDAGFLLWSMLSEYCQSQIEDLSGGSTTPHLRVPDCGKILLKVPPLAEQRAISNAIQSVATMLDQKEQAVAQLLGLKKALMQDLLTGKVRVKIDQKESAVA